MSRINTFYILIAFFFGFNVYSQTKAQRAEIVKNYDQEVLLKMAEESRILQTSEREKALKLARINNWPITYTDENGSFHALIRVTEDNKPVYYHTFNKNAAKSTRANFLHNGGGLGLNIEGQGMVAYVWDGGLARATHQEFSDGAGGDSRIIEGDPGEPTHAHATHVTGTIIAYGANPNAKGMAPKATVMSYDWFGDVTEATIESGNGMLISNHSYGASIDDLNDWQIGAYTMDSRAWDKIMYQAPYYLMVCAAGNDGYSHANGEPLDGNVGYDKLYDHTVSKNNLVVANGVDLNVNSNGEVIGSMSLDGSSSQGPTDDYRVKPDITGNGTSVYSCIDSSDYSYASYYGTSMASPNVAGSLLLLQQLYYEENGNYMLSSTLRGLALHNADDGGMVGPDAHFGWGYMNTKVAAECILNTGNTAEVRELILNDGETLTFQVTSDGTNPLLASICWTDKHSNNINTGPNANVFYDILESDLDIRVSKGATIYEPWKLTGVTTNAKGDNTVDNFERVDVDSASGVYTITVSHKDNLATPQAYALVVTGIVDGTNIGVASNKFLDFNIWPNPSNGKFNIFVPEAGNIEIILSDILGKEIMHKTYINTNSFVKQFDLTGLNKGLYLATIIKDGKKGTNKLVIE